MSEPTQNTTVELELAHACSHMANAFAEVLEVMPDHQSKQAQQAVDAGGCVRFEIEMRPGRAPLAKLAIIDRAGYRTTLRTLRLPAPLEVAV